MKQVTSKSILENPTDYPHGTIFTDMEDIFSDDKQKFIVLGTTLSERTMIEYNPEFPEDMYIYSYSEYLNSTDTDVTSEYEREQFVKTH